MPDTEQHLIQRAQKGDQEAFAALVTEHQRYVYNLALRVLKNEEEALDLAQETFVRAWTALPNFRGQSQFRTWLYRIRDQSLLQPPAQPAPFPERPGR